MKKENAVPDLEAKNLCIALFRVKGFRGSGLRVQVLGSRRDERSGFRIDGGRHWPKFAK